MNRKVIAVVLVIVGVVIVISGIAISYINSQKPDAGLKIDTNPASLVFVDNVQIGRTPVDKLFKAGEVALRLVPESAGSALTPYQTKIRLTSKTYSSLKRDFGVTNNDASGETITLEPQTGKFASLAIITSGPDSASVTVDGQPQGFTPLLISSLAAGDHQIMVSAPGYKERTVLAKAVIGYKLNINVKLAVLEVEVEPTPAPTKKAEKTDDKEDNEEIEIKDTPTGFLRVREKPSTSSKEVGRVNPGDIFELLETEGGWYRIEDGWISATYAKKI